MAGLPGKARQASSRQRKRCLAERERREDPERLVVGRERSAIVEILRRIWDVLPYVGDVWVPFVFHFDFADAATGRPVMVSERRWGVRDRYTVTVPDPRLDFRIAASMAVALDAHRHEFQGGWIDTGLPLLRQPVAGAELALLYDRRG